MEASPGELVAVPPTLRDGRPGVPWLVDAGKAASRVFREVWLFDGEAIELAPHLGGEIAIEVREESYRPRRLARAAAA